MGASTKTDPMRETWISRITPERTVGVYLGILVVVAIVAQAISSIPPSEEGSPIETFTTGLLWMLSFVALLSAFHASSRPRDMWFWLASSAGLAALAIDEAIGVHERTEPAGLNDDFVKVILWLGTPLLVAEDRRVRSCRTPSPTVLNAMCLKSPTCSHGRSSTDPARSKPGQMRSYSGQPRRCENSDVAMR